MTNENTTYLDTLRATFEAKNIKIVPNTTEPCRVCKSPLTLEAWMPAEGSDADGNKRWGTLLFQFCNSGHENLIN